METQVTEEVSVELPSHETAPETAKQASAELSLVDEGNAESDTPIDPMDRLDVDALDDLSTDDLDALASGDPETIARILGEEAPPEDQNNEQQAETEVDDFAKEEGEQPLAAESETEVKADEGPTRLSLKSLPVEDRKKTATAITLVRDGVFDTLSDAISHVYGFNHPKQLPAEMVEESDVGDSPVESEEIAEQLLPEVSEIQSRIEALIEERKTALAEYETDKAIEIGDQIAELKLEAYAAKQSAAAEQAQLDRIAQEEAGFIEKARDQYPDLLDEESRFYNEAVRERAYREAVEPEFFDNPDWPIRLAEAAKERIGGPATASTEKSGTYPGQGQAPPARPPGQVATGGNGVLVLSAEDAMAKVDAGEVDAETLLEELTRRELSVA